MLVELLVSVALPCRAIAIPAPSVAEGVVHWLLDGAWAPPVQVPEAHPGVVLARLRTLFHDLDADAVVTAGGGGLGPAASVAADEPGPELAGVPDGWEEGHQDFVVRARFAHGALRYAAEARLATRSRLEGATLRLVARGVWASLLPAEGDDPTYERDLQRALAPEGAFGDLRASLADAGTDLAGRLAIGLGEEVDPRVRVRVFERTDGVEELVDGLPAGTVRHLGAVGGWFGRFRPPGEVLRRRGDGTVELWRGVGDAR